MKKLMMLGVLLLAAGEARAECAPARMIKATLRNATPDVDPASFAAQPRTFYRLGNRYGRIEDAVDTEHGVHGLMVASEPDLWMINLLNNKGKHLVDKEAPQHFHIPVLAGPKDAEFLKGFELGCELDYLKAQGAAAPTPVTMDGRTFNSYSAERGEHRIVLVVDPTTGKPFSATALKSGKVLMHVRYEEYTTSLPPDMSLFVPPKNVKMLDPGNP